MLNQINPQAQVYLRSPAQKKQVPSQAIENSYKPKSMAQSVALQDITNNHNNNISMQPKKLKETGSLEIKMQKKSLVQSQRMPKSEIPIEKKEEAQQLIKSEKQSIQSVQSVECEKDVELTSYTNEELQRMQEANWLIFDQLCYSKQFFDDIFRNMLTNFASKIAFLQTKSKDLISTNKEIQPLGSREFLSMETSALFQQLMICDETWQQLYELMYSETRHFHQQCLIINQVEEIYSIDPRNLNQFTNIIIDINGQIKEETLKEGNKIFYDLGQFFGYCEHVSTLQVVLRNMNIADEQFNLIFSQFNKLKFMESFALDMCKNKITNTGIINFSQQLQELFQLQSLTLMFDFNQIASEGAIELGNAIMKLMNVNILNIQLGNNDITSKGAIQLFKGIKKLTQLVDLKLGLRNNILSDKMFEGFSSQMHNLFYLQKLEIDLYNNSISKVGFEALNQALLSGNYLFYLKFDIGRNEIEKIASFLKFLKYGNKLLGLKLYLDTNALKSSQLKEIIKSLQYQTDLTELKIDCSGYLLTTAFYKEISIIAEKLPKLERFELSLNSCKVSQEKVQLIIDGLSKFKGLRMLALSLTDNGLNMNSEVLKKNIKESNQLIEMIECFL